MLGLSLGLGARVLLSGSLSGFLGSLDLFDLIGVVARHEFLHFLVAQLLVFLARLLFLGPIVTHTYTMFGDSDCSTCTFESLVLRLRPLCWRILLAVLSRTYW